MATSFSNRTKPTTSYTNRTKPTEGTAKTAGQGSPIGLLLTLTYAADVAITTTTPSPSYTNRTKPSQTSYTNRTKP